ncbi:peptidoglycan recognition protein family protein [Patescibacteria group bacterium]|nr:peptidoglycan recognition protein family protein [Patescibacteria group bacterium]MBU1683132.1 peptidoglycan recognition protein family protein [Patescibacteria group bacterium]MBU1934657.1 peptidoglycan recognition protein family protein [Patescibacteria group bacterium]
MDIINRKLGLHEFEDYIRSYNFGTEPANKLVIHHTWRPTKEQWQGQASINGLKGYYERKGWSAGPHLFIAEDGIWLFSPMRKDGIHAGSLNHRTIGIEIVGDYDDNKWDGKTKYNALGAIKALMFYLHLENRDVLFHRDASPKSCPGWAITKEWLFEELANFRKKPRIPTIPSEIEEISAPIPSDLPQPEEVTVPIWAVEAIAFVKQHQLFEIRSAEDVRDAVKFYRFYKLIRNESQ